MKKVPQKVVSKSAPVQIQHKQHQEIETSITSGGDSAFTNYVLTHTIYTISEKPRKQIKEHGEKANRVVKFFRPTITDWVPHPNFGFCFYAKDKDPNVHLPLVKLYYGPYIANNKLKHREPKLFGLVECLKANGYSVELIRISYPEVLKVELYGQQVTRLNLKYLRFNFHHEDDPICMRTLQQIQEVTKRFFTSRHKTFSEILTPNII